MVITFVIDEYGLDTNGTTNFLRRYSRGLMSLGHEVRILCGRGVGEEKIFETGEAHYPFKKLVNSEGMAFAKYNKKIAIKALTGSDIVHFVLPFKFEKKVKRLADKLSIPSSADFHVLPENMTEAIHLTHFKFLNNYFYRKFRKFYNKFDIIHCPSELIKICLEKHKYKSNICVISNGVSPFFKRVNTKLDNVHRKKMLIMMTGRLSNEKRQDLIINAVKNSKYEKHIQLVFAGKGPMEEKYKKLAEGLTNDAIFNYYSEEELRFLLSNATLYIQSSDVETEGLTCLEAMSCKTCVIISDSKHSATSQYALSCYSLFNHGDFLSLRDKIDYLIENRDVREELAELYLNLSKNYSLDVSINRFINEVLIKSIENRQHEM